MCTNPFPTSFNCLQQFPSSSIFLNYVERWLPYTYPQKDNKSLSSNYQPIPLLGPVGKTMERCDHKHLYNYICENQILTLFQSGFLPRDSTTYQILHTYHTFCEAVDSGKKVRSYFCDISKAFDSVCDTGHLYKLSGIGFFRTSPEMVLKLLSRKASVCCSVFSICWCPQGSIRGQLLFLILLPILLQI